MGEETPVILLIEKSVVLGAGRVLVGIAVGVEVGTFVVIRESAVGFEFDGVIVVAFDLLVGGNVVEVALGEGLRINEPVAGFLLTGFCSDDEFDATTVGLSMIFTGFKTVGLDLVGSYFVALGGD